MKKNHLNDVLDDDSARKGDEHGLVEEDWIGVEVLQVKGLRRRRVPEKKIDDFINLSPTFNNI